MPFNPLGRSASASGPRRTYRQPAMLVPGIVLAVICVGFIVLIAVENGGSRLGEYLWPIAGLLVVWIIFLRPCVQLTQAGVVMRNLLRDVRFGWPAVDLIEQRWNLKIFDENGKGYGSWAITAQRPKRAARTSAIKSGPSLLRMGPGLGPVDEKNPTSVMKVRPGSAAAVASAIRDGQLDYAAATKRDASYLANDEVVAHPAWPAVTALVLAVLCVVVAILA